MVLCEPFKKYTTHSSPWLPNATQSICSFHFCWKHHSIKDCFLCTRSCFTLPQDLCYKLVMTPGPNLLIWLKHLRSSLTHKANNPGGVRMPKRKSRNRTGVPFKSPLTKIHPNLHGCLLPCSLIKWYCRITCSGCFLCNIVS